MAKYSLGVVVKNKNIAMPLFNEMCMGDIKIVDEFTGEFSCEEELKDYLIENGFISEEEKRKFRVVYTYGDKDFNLDVLYKNELKLLKNKGQLNLNFIYNFIYANIYNLDFLNKLANFYDYSMDKHPQKCNVVDIRKYIAEVNHLGYSSNEENYLQNAISDLINKATTNSKGILDYRKSRDLLCFIVRYIKENKLKEYKSLYSCKYEKEIKPRRYRTYADEEGYPGDLSNDTKDIIEDDEDISYIR